MGCEGVYPLLRALIWTFLPVLGHRAGLTKEGQETLGRGLLTLVAERDPG